MPGPTLNIRELAETLGRKDTWVYDNWKHRLCEVYRMPKPLHAGESPLIWDRAQIYAWLDRTLTPAQAAAAAAYRAARDAALEARSAHPEISRIANDTAELDARYGTGRSAAREAAP